ncbi:cupredoxin domain-containing protein [Nitrosopumilus maritimus]|nr:hypothetical protein [Nitrosopumilus maritimus]
MSTSILPVESYEFLFTEPQEVSYHCKSNPWMKGEISVKKSRF